MSANRIDVTKAVPWCDGHGLTNALERMQFRAGAQHPRLVFSVVDDLGPRRDVLDELVVLDAEVGLLRDRRVAFGDSAWYATRRYRASFSANPSMEKLTSAPCVVPCSLMRTPF